MFLIKYLYNLYNYAFKKYIYFRDTNVLGHQENKRLKYILKAFNANDLNVLNDYVY